MTTINAVAKVTVDLYVDAETLYDAEKILLGWFRGIEDDERLRSYVVAHQNWVPETEVPTPDDEQECCQGGSQNVECANCPNGTVDDSYGESGDYLPENHDSESCSIFD